MARVIGDGETFVAMEGPEPVGAYPHARRVGNLLFVSGLGPWVRGEKEIPGVVKDASGRVVSHDIVQARRTKDCSDALLRAQLRTGQHFLSPDAVAAAWARLNSAKEGKRA